MDDFGPTIFRNSGNFKCYSLPERMLSRRMAEDGRFAYGRVELKRGADIFHHPDALVFVDIPTDSQMRELEAMVFNHLFQSPSLVDGIKDRMFACSVHAELAGTTWSQYGREFNLSARSSGKIVAGLSGLNECCIDFFACGSDGLFKTGIREQFERSGFVLIGPFEWETVDEIALEMLEVCEQRPRCEEPPEWFGLWICECNAEIEMLALMSYYCLRGQVSLQEWEEFLILELDFED